jgi:hypothetical protein
MSEFFRPQVEKEAKPEPQQENREMYYRTMQDKMSMVFDDYPTGQERIEAIIGSNSSVLDQMPNGSEIRERLRLCHGIQSKREFVGKVSEILRPLTDFILDNRDRLVSPGEEGRNQVNELLSYDIRGNQLYIHVSGWEAKLTKYKEGLQEVAMVVRQNSDIETVEAVSWIVLEHPKILERLGFTVDKEAGQVALDGQGDGIAGRAYMTRNDFLEKYLSV